jgi:4a-hydroxytetrahydrobiopterin dehydratase
MQQECSLSEQECVPCKGGVPPLKGAALDELRAELGGDWRVLDEHHLEKAFTFKSYPAAVEFTMKVAAIAEEQQHHPDIHLSWGRVKVEVWTHKSDGLTLNDFVFAAKVDGLLSA